MKSQIKKSLRQLLNEISGVKYKYGCVMLYFDIEDSVWGKIQGLVDDEDISELADGEGREDEPHITLLYGIHDDVLDKDVEAIINNFTPVEITFNKIDIFENDEIDVVKFDIKDKELDKMNKALKELPHTSSYTDYKAHATIAFVKCGKGRKYVQTLSKEEAIVLKPSKIVYSKPNGTKKYYKFKNNEI